MGKVAMLRLLAGSGFTWLLFWLPLGRRAPTRCEPAPTPVHNVITAWLASKAPVLAVLEAQSSHQICPIMGACITA